MVVISDGPADTAFGVEYAALLAIAGSDVVLATSRGRLLPALDEPLEQVVVAGLADLGIRTVVGAAVSGDGATVTAAGAANSESLTSAVVVVPDVRTPFAASVAAPQAAGIATVGGAVPVDRGCRTNIANVYAVGDVTGGSMLSSAAGHMGAVAGLNATGGEARTRLSTLPHVVHSIPELGWVGLSEERARGQGIDVSCGMFDLGFNARALTLGAKQGVVKVVSNPMLGEILGAQSVGPETAEIVAVAAALIQAEVTVHDLASAIQWHPSVSEGLCQAAALAAK